MNSKLKIDRSVKKPLQEYGVVVQAASDGLLLKQITYMKMLLYIAIVCSFIGREENRYLNLK